MHLYVHIASMRICYVYVCGSLYTYMQFVDLNLTCMLLFTPLESIISPSATSLDPGLINSLPLRLLNSSGIVKDSLSLSVGSNI